MLAPPKLMVKQSGQRKSDNRRSAFWRQTETIPAPPSITISFQFSYLFNVGTTI